MQRILHSFLYSSLLIGLCLGSHGQAAQEILLRSAPETNAPPIAKVMASQKVILDAAPAPENADAGWRQLPLPAPFEGYVPLASVNKALQIEPGTPVHYLPTAESAKITQVDAQDSYEVIRAGDTWATVRIRKPIIGFFNEDAAKAVAFDFDSVKIPQVSTEAIPADPLKPGAPATPLARTAPTPVSAPDPVAIPARPTRINPDEPISQLDPQSMPPENVIWKPVAEANLDPEVAPRSQLDSRPGAPAASPGEGFIVSPALTQAREPSATPSPEKTPRLLTGILEKKITPDGPSYPIQLRSPDGRLIAFVDLSKIYISDLSPFLRQKVYIRGQIHSLPGQSSRLVIFAENLRLAE